MAQSVESNPNRMRFYSLIVFSFGIGIILRLIHYLENRSLWLDEAMLATNLVQKTFLQLLQGLDYIQIAPVGFLLAEESVSFLFGTSEYALRLFPLVTGIASIFIFYKLATSLGGVWVAVLGLFMFSLSRGAIYYSAELKPYSTDVLFALLLYFFAHLYLTRPRLLYRVALVLIGAASIWFSFPSVFILAAIGSTLGVYYLYDKDWKNLAYIVVGILLWLVSFLAHHYIILEMTSDYLSVHRYDFWLGRDAFMPFPPTSLGDLKWFWKSLEMVFAKAMGSYPMTFALFLYVVGLSSLWRNNRLWVFMFVTPIAITMLVSGLQFYPWWPRLILFLVPSVILVIAIGLMYIKQIFSVNYRGLWWVALTLLLVRPVGSALINFREYPVFEREDTKTVMKHISKEKLAGDCIYVYAYSIPPFEYYAPRFGLDAMYAIYGESPNVAHLSSISKTLRSSDCERLWVLSSQIRQEEERRLLQFFDTAAQKLDSIEVKGASGSLYEFAFK